MLEKRSVLSILFHSLHLLLLHFPERTFHSKGQSLTLTRQSLSFLELQKNTIDVGVKTEWTSKSICRHFESSLIFLAKNVSLGWNVTTKGTLLVESFRVLSVFQKLPVSFAL